MRAQVFQLSHITADAEFHRACLYSLIARRERRGGLSAHILVFGGLIILLVLIQNPTLVDTEISMKWDVKQNF